MKSLLAALFASVFLFVSGLMVINWQLWNMARYSAITAARQSVGRIDAIIEEARLAADAVMPLAQGRCTHDTVYALSREAALRPHIRAVALLKGRTVWCSSFTGDHPLTLSEKSISTDRLTLYSGELIAPGVPLLVWLIPAHGSYVAVSINDVHLRDALESVQENLSLSLIVGNRLLGWKGGIRPYPIPSFTMLTMSSSHFPFSVGYNLPPWFSLQRFYKQGLALSVMTAFFSLLAGGLFRRYLVKYTTPAENLRKAMERNEIIPYYQPVVNGRTGKINGVEVLARWKHPVAGFIPPDVFIPVAEKSGLITPLTRYLMQKVQADLIKTIHHLPQDFHIAMNISAGMLTSSGLNGNCLFFLNAFNKAEITLVLEITERTPLEIAPELHEQLAILRGNGIKLALDDFGTGYSGLSYLNEIVFDFIKIDKSFVSRITAKPETTRLINCVIDMARKMSFSIIAEGIENKTQADYLTRKNIQLLQGYYYFRPVPFRALVKIMLNEEAAARKVLR